MITIGTYNTLIIKQASPDGWILENDGQEVLLPYHSALKNAAIGDELFLFVYHDKEGRVVATRKRPYACAGDFAFLKVVEVTSNGAFLDLGIDKDVFIGPQQKQPLEVGESYVVYVYLDERDEKLVATTWLEDHLDTTLPELDEGQEVSLLIYSASDLGYNAIVDNRYNGLLYRDEVYEELWNGQSCTGYVKKIRQESNKIDLSLRPIGFDFILEAKTTILNLLKENGGTLNLGDKSLPDDIRSQLKMSKKAFKQVIGSLYKERLITLSDHEIRLAVPTAPEEDL